MKRIIKKGSKLSEYIRICRCGTCGEKWLELVIDDETCPNCKAFFMVDTSPFKYHVDSRKGRRLIKKYGDPR